MKYRIEVWSVGDIIQQYEDKNLKLNPDYQRRYIWKLSDQQTLIESIFSGFAIPNIFLHRKGRRQHNPARCLLVIKTLSGRAPKVRSRREAQRQVSAAPTAHFRDVLCSEGSEHVAGIVEESTQTYW